MRTEIGGRTVLVPTDARMHQSCASRGLWCLASVFVAGAVCALPATSAFADISPTVNVGAGVRTSSAVTDPSGGKKVEATNLDSVRLYVSGSITGRFSFMFNTEVQKRPACRRPQHPGPRRGRPISLLGPTQHLGRPISPAQRSRQQVRPLLLEPVERLQRWRTGRSQVGINNPSEFSPVNSIEILIWVAVADAFGKKTFSRVIGSLRPPRCSTRRD
jgi:hypothetical protein